MDRHMWELLRKYRMYVVVGVVLLAAFIFYSLNLKNKEHANAFESGVLNLMAPLSGVVAGINRTATGVWSDYVDLLGVRKENKQLRASVKILNSPSGGG